MSGDALLPDQVPAPVEDDLGGSEVPAELDEYGRTVWVEMTPILEKAGRLKMSDRAAWKRYCQLAGRYWKAAKELKDYGSEFYDVPTVALDENGKPGMMTRRRPQCLTMEKLLPELRQQEDRFGMSPLARTNLVAKGLRGGAGLGAPGNLFDGTGGADSSPDDDGTGPDPSAFH